MATSPFGTGPLAPAPARWTPVLTGAADTAPDADEKPDPLKALGGLGAALGYWLPVGINRANASTKRLWKTVQ